MLPHPEAKAFCSLYLKEIPNFQHPEIYLLIPYARPLSMPTVLPPAPSITVGNRFKKLQHPEINLYPPYIPPLPALAIQYPLSGGRLSSTVSPSFFPLIQKVRR
jgi:hypothetical protein